MLFVFVLYFMGFLKVFETEDTFATDADDVDLQIGDDLRVAAPGIPVISCWHGALGF